VHGTVSSAALFSLPLVIVAGVRRRIDIWRSTVHGALSIVAVIILLLVGGVWHEVTF